MVTRTRPSKRTGRGCRPSQSSVSICTSKHAVSGRGSGSCNDRQIAGHGLVEYGVCFVWLVGVMPLQSTLFALSILNTAYMLRSVGSREIQSGVEGA